MEKEIFKVGDEVYYYDLKKGCLKGKIVYIYNDQFYSRHPVIVRFERIDIPFTFDGRCKKGELPSLSFAPYDLVNGGFTQERPLPEIEVDRLIYYRFSEYDEWMMGFFSHFKNGGVYVYADQGKSTDSVNIRFAQEWSLKNPLE